MRTPEHERDEILHGLERIEALLDDVPDVPGDLESIVRKAWERLEYLDQAIDGDDEADLPMEAARKSWANHLDRLTAEIRRANLNSMSEAELDELTDVLVDGRRRLRALDASCRASEHWRDGFTLRALSWAVRMGNVSQSFLHFAEETRQEILEKYDLLPSG